MTSEYSGPLRPDPKPDKKIEKVTLSSDPVVKPKGLGRKFKETFFGGDARQAVGYMVSEVLLPGVRNLVFDGGTKWLERTLYGSSGPMRRPFDYRPRTQYSSPFQRTTMPVDPRSRGIRLPDQGGYRQPRMDMADIVLATHEDCEVVVERMLHIADNYDLVSLADLYELLGQPTTATDHKWGWTNLSQVQIRQVRGGGFTIDLPPLEAL